MSALYIDTSVLVAYYVPEVHSDQAEVVIRNATDRVISPLCLSEASAALAARVHAKTLTNAQGRQARDQIIAHYHDGYFRQHHLDDQHFAHAATLVWQVPQRLRTLDALHLAVAQLGGYTLATADLRLRDAALAAQVEVKWVGVLA